MVTLQLSQLEVLPDQRVVLQGVNWQQFEAILEELGEHRATRLVYYKGRRWQNRRLQISVLRDGKYQESQRREHVTLR